MYCTNCGKEMEEGWAVCPNCGSSLALDETMQSQNMEQMCREYHFVGIRRNGIGKVEHQRVKLFTDVKVEGEKISVSRLKKPRLNMEFYKCDVKSIDLPILPIWWILDYFRLAIYGLVMLCSYGLGIFFVFYGVRCMLSRHIRIALKSGEMVKIPICQKADASEFLKEFNYPQAEIEKNDSKKIDEDRWLKREMMISKMLFWVAGTALVLGVKACYVSTQEFSYIREVKECSPNPYPSKTYGEEFEKFFQSPNWEYFKGVIEGEDEDGDGEPDIIERDLDIVEFTGDYVEGDETIKVLMQFKLSKEDDTCEIAYLSFNGISQEDIVIAGFVEMIFGEQEDGLAEEGKDGQEEEGLDEMPETMDSDEDAEANIQDMEMYLSNSSGVLPIKIDNVYKEIAFAGFTTIGFEEVNMSGEDMKEAIYGVVAWDSNMLPLELKQKYGGESAYLYKCRSSNIAAGQTMQRSITLEENDFKYMQILLLECSDFDGNTWTNPAASYFEENYAGKKFDESFMYAIVFEADIADSADMAEEEGNDLESPEDIASCTGDFYTDVDNGVLYGKDGMIVDANGNPIQDYAGYFVTKEGYISNGDWCEEGYCVDSTGKIIKFSL